MEDARLELMVAASMKDICMVEGECKEVSEQEMLGALKAAHEAIKIQCQAQIELMEQVNKAKREYCHEVNDENLRAEIEASTSAKRPSAASLTNISKNIPKKSSRPSLRSPSAISTTWNARPCVTPSLTSASASTAVRPTRCVLSGPKSTCCPRPTAQLCSPVVRHRPS